MSASIVCVRVARFSLVCFLPVQYARLNIWLKWGTRSNQWWKTCGVSSFLTCRCSRRSTLPRRGSCSPFAMGDLSMYMDGTLTLYRETPLNWTAAEANCVRNGGHLASIHSMMENAIVASLCGNDECWIGFNDIEQEGTWVWADGSSANFSSFPGGIAPWNPGEPNGRPNEQTDGAYIYPPTNIYVVAGAWDDDDIAVTRPYVCKHDPMPTPPPSPSPPPRPTKVGEFQFFSEKKNFNQAEAYCETLGGFLASIHSMVENALVQSLCHPVECWIGYNDIAHETQW
eukprot:5888001-Prymnesium_polylepis.1